MRALGVALSLASFLALAGCSSGVSCTDKGGTCVPGAICPNGTEPPTPAQFEAAGTQSTAYTCASTSAAVDSGTDVPSCCLPIPTTN